ncbi:MAG TPA: cyclic nucleotide-binding domain-containing protein [Anaerolineales bacterium]|nr:cyclic nucleotide-binding domain-containing protein [Anaerolineales bacterium]
MDENRSRFIDFLRRLTLFEGLTESQIAQIASRFTIIRLEQREALFTGREAEEHSYLILSGKVGVVNPERKKGEKEPPILGAGEFFNEEELLYAFPASAQIQALQPARLMFLSADELYALVRDFPQIKPNLTHTQEGKALARREQFRWLNGEEIIHHIARKHEFFLAASLIWPLMLFIGAVFLAILIASGAGKDFLWLAGVAISIVLALVGIAWGVWNYLDWGNDYYIVTNQRVVWVEKVIWLYDSRDEAPLETILSENVATSLIGRILHYGDVTVRTFTGQILFRNVREPYLMTELVKKHRELVSRRGHRVETEATAQAIHRLFVPADDIYIPPEPAPSPEPEQERPLGFLARYFANFLRMRFEEGIVITYRKYWTALLVKTWLPTLLILVDIFFLIGCLIFFFWGRIFAADLGLWLSLALGAWVVLFPWWLYHYADWRNDIYQVTDKYILDIERRPLGTEVKKSAPLESILSLEHERPGFLGYLLNFGNVTINVGETKFVFLSVHEPARVQQDIFNRMYTLRKQKERAEIARERDRVVQMMSFYKQNVEDKRFEDESGNYDQELS